MRALGLAVSINGKRSTVSAVVLNDHTAAGDAFDPKKMTVEDSFEVKGDQPDAAVQLGDAAKAVGGRVSSLRPDVVVVRRADRPARASNQEGPRLRLLIEGAITASARNLVPNTHLRNGKDCGAAYGGTKDSLDTEAGQVHGGKYCEATAAAMSGLAANRA